MPMTDKEIALELTKAALDFYKTIPAAQFKPADIETMFGNFYHEVKNIENTVRK